MRFKNLEYSKKTIGGYFLLYIDSTYSELCSLLGEPKGKSSIDGKVRVEWIIELENKVVFTIYDWKEYDTPIEEVTIWHVGGEDKDLPYIRDFLFNDLSLIEFYL